MSEDGRKEFRRSGKAARAERRGTCELCGKHNQALRILAVGDFIGWCCPECMRELRDSMIRKAMFRADWTEPED